MAKPVEATYAVGATVQSLGQRPRYRPTHAMRAVGAAVAVGVIAAGWPTIDYRPFTVIMGTYIIPQI